jgi:peroxiredoxin
MSNSGLNPSGDHTGKREGRSAKHRRLTASTEILRPPVVTLWLSSGGWLVWWADPSEGNDTPPRDTIRARRLSRLEIEPAALEPDRNGIMVLDERPAQLSHLISTAMPVLPGCTCGSSADENYAHGWTVVYFYAGQSSDQCQSNPDDLALHAAYSHHHYDLAAMRVSVAGISTEPAKVQQERRTRCAIPHDLLSDPELRFALALQLPTQELDGNAVYDPLALVMRDGVIHRTFYPVGDRPRHVGEVVAWILRQERDGRCKAQ